jgi:putative heme transporter
MEQQAVDEQRRKRAAALRFGGSAALIVAIFWFVLPQVADLSDVWRQVRAMTPLELATLGLAAAWNLVTYWILLVQATPGLSYAQAMVLTESTTAVSNTVPGGSAVAVGLSYGMLHSWGFSRSRTSVSVLVSGIWNNFAKLGLPIVGLVLLALQGSASPGRVAGAVAGLAALVASIGVFALILRREEFARHAGDTGARWAGRLLRLLGRPPATGWGDATVKFRGRVVGLVEERWLRLTAATIVGHLSLFLVLLLALRHVGVSQRDVTLGEALAVFAFVRLLTAIPITPGGLGFVELGLSAGLVGAGGMEAEVVAAVLVFRLLTFVLPIPFGVATYVFWRRNRSWRDSAPPLVAA